MAEETPTINLKVLSPSTEVEGGVNLADVPTTTTIKELRSRIQDAVPSKPATERMRLIYRGRVVANDADTLADVFGAENIRENKDQSLHLVLRELPPTSSASSSPPPRSATAPLNPFRPAQPPTAASPPLQTNPFRTLPQPRPSSQPPEAPSHHHHHHHPHVHHHHPPRSAFPLPPSVQQQLVRTMAMAQAEQMNNAQSPPATAQDGQLGGGGPAPQNGAQAPPMGLPPLPGMGPPGDGRTVRQEGIGPNGERWSVTYSSTTIPATAPQAILPRPFVHPPAFGMPPRPNDIAAPTEALDRLLPRMRFILQTARQEMENVRTLLQTSGQQATEPTLAALNPPPWRLDRIRQHIQAMGHNLNLVERGLGVIAADAAMTNNPDVIALRQSANELREHLEELNRMMGQRGDANATQTPSMGTDLSTMPEETSVLASRPPVPTQSGANIAPLAIPFEAPEELFLLSSPQGPVGILFDQRGTYMTAPMVPTLPFQAFANQFAQNRQVIGALGQHIAQGSHMNAQNTQATTQSHGNVQPTPTQPPAAAVQAQNQAQAADQGQAQAQPQPQVQVINQNANPPANAQAENDRIGNIAGHAWLVFKLACFVYFFSGTGWYKSILLGLIAGGVYLAQIGAFEAQFALIRRHFEAVLPIGALAAPAQPPAAEARRNMTPEEAARRLLQQRQDQRFGWVRDSMRTVERSFAIFVASLWPGIGERMVHAQEERERLARVQEEERVRQAEEEQRKREEEAQKASEEKKDAPEGESAAGSSRKGKERAEVAEDDEVEWA